VLQAMNPVDFSVEGKMSLLQGEQGHIAKATNRGVEHLLVDPGIIDLLSVGTVKNMISEVRENGCLAGAAPHNAFGSWGGLNEKFGSGFKPAAVLNALPIAWGGDFVIFGPVSLAPVVFPAVAMVDAILAQPLMDLGKIPDPSHPMFKIA
jgi:tetrahydromethanopterin S-methyltransferase subunit H